MKVLVFSPHPDDDLIGCGGSIAKHVKQGHDVASVYLTSGEAGSLDYSKEELAKIREAEAKAATEMIGVTNQTFLREPDGYLEYNQKNLIRLVNLIRSEKPNVVYIPHKDDAHNDHRKTYELVTDAIGRASGPWFQECEGKPWSVETILCYEIWTTLQDISYVEDISEFIDLKFNALAQHKSQIKDIKYNEAVKGLNKFRGIMTGKGDYCECFQLLRVNKLF